MDDKQKKLYELKIAKLKALELANEERENLPHRSLFKHYKWSRKFFDDTKTKVWVVCAANQIGKSSFQIRRVIEWATNSSLWPILWPNLQYDKGQIPNMFWYFYPTKETATSEFFTKWMQFMPKDKEHPQYGWQVNTRAKMVESVTFNNGVTIYFKTYGQGQEHVQAGSVFYLAVDEECPENMVDELLMRISATQGYASFVFTATQGQEFWRQVVEERSVWNSDEIQVRKVSLYDCIEYEDGSPSQWNRDAISKREALCKSENEVIKRIHGGFAPDEGLKYPTFSETLYVDPVSIPQDWQYFAGVDYGGGNASSRQGHLSAISIVAVKPDFTKGYLVDFWRGDGIDTTADDVVERFIQMRKGRNVIACYDYAAKDLASIGNSRGAVFVRAEKSHELGEFTLNALMKNRMLEFFDFEESRKLTAEFRHLTVSKNKRSSKDDGIDSLRYCCNLIPWNWDAAGAAEAERKAKNRKNAPPPSEEQLRRGLFQGDKEEDDWVDELMEEMDYWEEQYG